MTSTPGVVLLMGPTASGKTALSLQLAARLQAMGRPAEIISVDSAQVYRGMDIGTAKPDAEERAAVPHHLLDICDPADIYSAARFCTDARRLIADIRARGRTALLVGGSMLYFRALTTGLSNLPPADPVLRARLTAQAESEGWPAMHVRLAELDPAAAARLHPNDGQRIQRALEVIETTGTSLSALHGARVAGAEFGFVKFALMPPERAALHARIATRLRQMMARGFLDEVARLRSRDDLHAALPSLRSVGYRQLWAHLDGHDTLAQAEQKALEATRQFAKRQITWLRSEHDLCWLNTEAPDAVDLALRQID